MPQHFGGQGQGQAINQQVLHPAQGSQGYQPQVQQPQASLQQPQHGFPIQQAQPMMPQMNQQQMFPQDPYMEQYQTYQNQY